MYTGWTSEGHASYEWMQKTDHFLNRAFGKAAKFPKMALCPCSKCGNRRMLDKELLGKHLHKNGFTPNYTRWVHHGEADGIREEVVRQAGAGQERVLGKSRSHNFVQYIAFI
jgi:hypothetical protein